ncbi:MAG: response regulator transcription factor [Proteobacteria bacterium]|nr:response regulator transcription factor [Desulfocapsa sp.]MBU3943408.1 response regulator transcription factor [Pseudomonadota bacterium]MBU3982210.1 response regulator transcription factor [Pseudomonadota bacterium]MBU4030026.1 response regulator transcription factor [Pseudomonadota bacterium]MBU4041893.1 response regulator transcription factor [Pseudomonadota bacterium]
MPMRLALVDDHAIVREGLRALLEQSSFIQVVGEAATGRECLSMIENWRPDVVIMDISMPDINGIEATRLIKEQWPRIKVVILSMHSTAEYIYRAFAAGACGYVLKDSIGEELLSAIKAALSNKRYLSAILQDADIAMKYLSSCSSPLASLSNRERQVLQLVVEGNTSAYIAQRLTLSPKTVETYRSRIMQKLDLHDTPSLVKFAILHGLTSLD